MLKSWPINPALANIKTRVNVNILSSSFRIILIYAESEMLHFCYYHDTDLYFHENFCLTGMADGRAIPMKILYSVHERLKAE